MSVALSPIGNAFQFFSNGGIPLIGGKLYTYQAGTSTPEATFTDVTGAVQNANPIVFLASGRLANEIWLTVGIAYKFELRDALGNLIATYDNITAIPSSVNIASFTDFGAVGNDSFDNQQAFQDAFDADVSLLYGAKGIYRTGGNSSVTNPVRVLGAGPGSFIVRATNATANIWTVSAEDTVIDGITFDSSATRTAGAYLHYDTNGNRGHLDNFTMFGAYYGVHISALATVRVTNGSLRIGSTTAGSAGIYLDGGGDHELHAITMDNAAGSMISAGIKIVATEAVFISNCDIIHCTDDLLLAPGNGQVVAAVYCQNTFFDTATRGIHVNASGTGSVVRCHFDGCWTSSHTGDGVLITSAGGTLDGFSFVDHDAYSNGGCGMRFDAGLNVTISASRCAANTSDGIQFAANLDKFSVQGCRCGTTDDFGPNGGFGLNILAGTSNNIRVQNNNFILNTGGTAFNGSVGAAQIVRNNLGYITENSGSATINNGATSVTFNHGLSVTPDGRHFWLTPKLNPTNDPGNLYIDTLTATQATVHCRSDPGASGYTFGWGVAVLVVT